MFLSLGAYIGIALILNSADLGSYFGDNPDSEKVSLI